MYQNCCKKCGSVDLFTKEKGYNVGLYCSDCGAWIKWLGKEELNAFNHKEEINKKCNCYKYTNPLGTTFLECKTKYHGIILGSTQHYPEEIKFCPFCGNEYKE